MDTVRASHIGLNGSGIWYILHSSAIEAVDDEHKKYFEYLVDLLLRRIKCKQCIDHFNKFLEQNPLSKYRKYK
jgi:hypothetical protein